MAFIADFLIYRELAECISMIDSVIGIPFLLPSRRGSYGKRVRMVDPLGSPANNITGLGTPLDTAFQARHHVFVYMLLHSI